LAKLNIEGHILYSVVSVLRLLTINMQGRYISRGIRLMCTLLNVLFSYKIYSLRVG